MESKQDNVDVCSNILRQLGYSVKEEKDHVEMSKDEKEYSIYVVNEKDSYLIIPIDSTRITSEHIFTTESDFVGFVSHYETLYMFKTNSMRETLSPLIKQLKTNSCFGFTDNTSTDFKKIHVRQDENGEYISYLHIPTKWAQDNIKNYCQTLERKEDEEDEESVSEFSW